MLMLQFTQFLEIGTVCSFKCFFAHNGNDNNCYINDTMQSYELAHLSKVYSVIAGACIPIFHCILNNSA